MLERKCLYRYGSMEAENYRRARAEAERRDPGRRAVREWNEKFWWDWCLKRFLEHLQGEMFWEQFDDATFAILRPVVARVRGVRVPAGVA